MDQDAIQAFRDKQAQEADVEKQDGQHNEVVSSLNNLLLATMVSKDPKMVEVAENLASLLDSIGTASEAFANSDLQLLPLANHNLTVAVQELTRRVDKSPDELKPYFDNLANKIQTLTGVRPVVNVPTQPVKVDLTPLIKEMGAVKKAISDNKIDIPKNDVTEIVKELKAVQKTINSLSFPVPNYILPFRNTAGAAVQVQLDSSGNIPVTSSGGAAGTQYAELITTAPATGTVALGRYKSSAPTLTDGQLYAPQLDASGNLKVNIQAGAGSGGTAMVDDAAFTVAVTSITPVGGTYKSTRDAVDDGDAGALAMNPKRGLYVSLETPNSDSAMDDTLDTVKVSQATAANLNMTEASASGILTSVQLIDDTITAQGTALGTTKTSLQGGSVTTAAPTYTNGQISPLNLTTSGALRIDLGATSANATAVKVDGSAVTQPVSGTVSITANSSVNVAQINGVTTLMGNGVTGTGSQRVTIASDNTAFAVNATLSAETTKVIGTVNQGTSPWVTSNATTSVVGNGAAATAQRVTLANDSTGIVALTTSAATIGKLAANSGVDIGDVDVTTIAGVAPAFNTGVRSATTQRVTIATDDVVPASQSGTWTVQPGNTANSTPWLTTQTPKTSGGLTTFHLVSAATTNATNIKASAGQVFGWFIYNSNASARKLVFHNSAGTPTAGASVFFSIVIPPTSGANVEFTNGIAFSTGIAITTVTGLADTDSAAVALNDLVINVYYA